MGRHLALHYHVAEGNVRAAATQACAVLQQQHAGVERLVAVVVFLQQQLSALRDAARMSAFAHIHHRAASGIVGSRHHVVCGHVRRNIPRLKAAVVHRVADALVARYVAAVADHLRVNFHFVSRERPAVYVGRCLHQLILPMVVGHVGVGLGHACTVVRVACHIAYAPRGRHVHGLYVVHVAIYEGVVQYAGGIACDIACDYRR